MTPIHPHDYIQSYEAGLAALKKSPLDRDLQHQVVLALARAGALDFALSEYARYDLAAVRDHEDIMALNGRLSKDLYLRSSGSIAQKHAEDAARKYEAAFQNTLGYYSGINSATMAFMADLSAERVAARVDAIEALLPVSREITPTDHYFIEATRAECFLLKGERSKAVATLHAAIDFDPLNYAAHASTIKQFMMISNKRGESLDWLTDFRPPRPLHYAGHIRLDQTNAEQAAMRISIADALQQEDVGFGFGALAAGGDILFAESLLEQGAELHVVLPCDRDLFKRESVTPFGKTWGDRFEACLEQASSFRQLTKQTRWPDKQMNRMSGLSAMGKTILQGQSLSVSPLQMLILRDTDGPSYTATHAQDWAGSSHAQFRLIGGNYRPISVSSAVTDSKIPCSMKYDGSENAQIYADPVSAITSALEIKSQQGRAQIALHMNIEGEVTEVILDHLLEGGSPQSLLASEAFATVFAAVAGDQYKITYAGQLSQKVDDSLRCYTIQPLDVLSDSVA